jgi:hypothetical protein
MEISCFVVKRVPCYAFGKLIEYWLMNDRSIYKSSTFITFVMESTPPCLMNDDVCVALENDEPITVTELDVCGKLREISMSRGGGPEELRRNFGFSNH